MFTMPVQNLHVNCCVDLIDLERRKRQQEQCTLIPVSNVDFTSPISLKACLLDRQAAERKLLLDQLLALSSLGDKWTSPAVRSSAQVSPHADQGLSGLEEGMWLDRRRSLGERDYDPRVMGQGRYKTERCRSFEENGFCKYGDKCQFAHGMEELRSLIRHPKYKTELCRSFHTVGYCPYGSRCHFIHQTEQPVIGRAMGAESLLTNERSDLFGTRAPSLYSGLKPSSLSSSPNSLPSCGEELSIIPPGRETLIPLQRFHLCHPASHVPVRIPNLCLAKPGFAVTGMAGSEIRFYKPMDKSLAQDFGGLGVLVGKRPVESPAPDQRALLLEALAQLSLSQERNLSACKLQL